MDTDIIISDNAKTFKFWRSKYQFRVLNNFIKQWQREYLLGLQERRVGGTGLQKSQQIKIGDIVVLREDSTACCLWKLAKVLELFKGRGEMIRSARVQVLSKDKIIHLRRPIQHLVPLEADQI